MRYFEISLYRVRPGHRAQWNELVKLVKAAYEKIPDTHWAMYEADSFVCRRRAGWRAGAADWALAVDQITSQVR
jgi:hypothetical protein